MVENTLRMVDPSVPIRMVHALCGNIIIYGMTMLAAYVATLIVDLPSATPRYPIRKRLEGPDGVAKQFGLSSANEKRRRRRFSTIKLLRHFCAVARALRSAPWPALRTQIDGKAHGARTHRLFPETTEGSGAGQILAAKGAGSACGRRQRRSRGCTGTRTRTGPPNGPCGLFPR